ncbi:type IV secretion system protein [Luteimonas fraxinea]|uniref:Type IV secretion system protein n=1 Tax=Luteimonas fraxinea TaxID=2901869 RepID=A0ABS8UF26_9GAMM|nr:type IV secretion system protein [Luteimonas fraxinea]MCD9098106.1 type IV secretion system protein [Luteimonas fraxinea]MCD9125363.1 type IV secretion system protein [Luteimonas fraxinea]UHH09168.1 type IV secretion system protein [Luteimonas fraxinea]
MEFLPDSVAMFNPSGFASWAFFKFIFGVVNSDIAAFQNALLGRTTRFVSGIVFTLLVLWVLIQGFLIVTGRSRESLMGLVVGSLRAFLIVIAATSMSFFGNNLTTFFTSDLPTSIHQVVSGNDSKVEDAIDKNLQTMGLIFALVDALPTQGSDANTRDQKAVTNLTGIGIAGPSVIGGAMLLLYKIALVLFVGFGPLFILALLFDQTKDLFKRWLLYGIGTMFAMAVLAVMVSIATKVVAMAAAAMVAAYTLSSIGIGAMGPGFGGGLNSAAVQQGGVGLLMSVLMVMTPPMAAMFFNGTLGQFAANSSFGNVGRNSTGQVSDFKQETLPSRPRRGGDGGIG